MKCPACSNELKTVSVDGIDVDVCHGGCGGLWFDQFEFKKFDEPHEAAGTELLDVPVNPNLQVDYESKRACPKCDGFTMMRNTYSVKREVEIDTCAGCAGTFLDAGELNTIRGQYESEEARKAAAVAVFEDVLEPELDARVAQTENAVEQSRRFANMVKFICPSYYIPNKQKWGAF